MPPAISVRRIAFCNVLMDSVHTIWRILHSSLESNRHVTPFGSVSAFSFDGEVLEPVPTCQHRRNFLVQSHCINVDHGTRHYSCSILRERLQALVNFLTRQEMEMDT